MSLRYWIADLISGGALKRAEILAEHWERGCFDARQHRNEWHSMYDEARHEVARWQREANEGWGTATLRLIALQQIAAMPTPKANATVRRMARVAEEAVK